MAVPALITRRFALLGALVSTAALAVPAARAANVGESTTTKIDRLTQELSEALTEYCNGQFRAVVQPSNSECPVLLVSQRQASSDADLLDLIKNGDPSAQAEYHSTRLGIALSKARGGKWITNDFPRGERVPSVVMFVQHPGQPAAFVQNFG